jgi:hypothetical protein
VAFPAAGSLFPGVEDSNSQPLAEELRLRWLFLGKVSRGAAVGDVAGQRFVR